MRVLVSALVLGAVATAAHARPAPVSIMSIQGRAHASPFAGDSVVTTGIVTVAAPDGFHLQDPAGDGEDATSDAVFVFTSAPPSVRAGDEVRVEGPVREFLPGNDPENLTVTEIHRPRVTVLASGRPLPAPVEIGGGGRIPPARVIDDDGLARYEPDRDGIDFQESLEGMRVRLARPRVVQATNSFGEVWVVCAGTPGASERGALAVTAGDAHPGRVQIDDARLPSGMPPFDVGDELEDVTGAVSYRFGAYEVLAESAPRRVRGGLAREIDALPRGADRIRVASFNVRNLGPADAERAEALARHIVSHLGAPEILGLQEILDDSGLEDDGVTGGTRTLAFLAEAIRAAGGPAYDYREIPPADGADGGVPGGNIRVAFLFDPARVSFVDRGDVTGSAETRPFLLAGQVALTRSPGRIAPAHPAWVASRKPLAGEFRAGGTTLFVVAAHFVSRSRSSPAFGAYQPPRDPDGGKRLSQAERVAGFVSEILAIDPRARVVVLGDLNDDWFSAPLAALEGAGLHGALLSLPEAERYSILFDGRAQLFDHVLVSAALRESTVGDVVHIEAEFASGSSDHDPVVVSVALGDTRAPAPLLALPGPNPFADRVAVAVDAAAGPVHGADVFDVRGRRVRALGAPAGVVTWDGRDDTGRPAPAGVYWIRVITAGGTASRAVVRVRAP